MSTYPEPPIIGQPWTVAAAAVAAAVNASTTKPTLPWRFLPANSGGRDYPAWLTDQNVPAGTWGATLGGTPPAAGTFTLTLGKYTGGLAHDKRAVTFTVADPTALEAYAFPQDAKIGHPYKITAAAVATAAGLTDAETPLLTDPRGQWPEWLTPRPVPGVPRVAGPVTGTPPEGAADRFVIGVDDYSRGTVYGSGTATVRVIGGTPPAPVVRDLVAQFQQGVAAAYPLAQAAGVTAASLALTGTLPQGLTLSDGTVTGTPTAAGEWSGAYSGTTTDGAPVKGAITWQVAAPPVPETPETPEDPGTDTGGGGTGPGTGPGDTTPEPDAETREAWARLMAEDPQAEFVVDALVPRALRYVERTADDAAGSREHVLTVLEYVKAYTRGRGFTGYIPHRSLAAVIVAASGRLITNPEQVAFYQTGDYSERPAVLAGWTAAELGVLRRFRQVYA